MTSTRIMLAIYAVVITAGLVLFTVVGLTHG